MSAELVDQHYTVTPTIISGFFREHRWLSNFHMCPVRVEGIIYPSSEHAYMAQKTLFQDIREHISNIPTAKEVKQFGREMKISCENWDEYRIIAMLKVNYAKFTQNSELREALLATGDSLLEENNWWGDLFWGTNMDGEGKNMLGKTLMAIRDMLR